MASHTPDGAARVLAVNAGSSSVKFAVFRAGDSPQEVLRGKLEHVGDAIAVAMRSKHKARPRPSRGSATASFTADRTTPRRRSSRLNYSATWRS